MCCTVRFIETNHTVFLSVRALIAGRHFAHMQHLRVTSIESTMCQHRLTLAQPLYQILFVPCRCSERFQTVQELLVHLKRHLVEGRSVTCPVASCQSTFTLKSSFTAHLSRKHPQCSVNNINVIYRDITPQCSATACEEASQTLDGATEEGTELPPNFNETFLRNVCLFYLKLQGQLLLPASTIQIIVEEMQNVHELGLEQITLTLER